MSASHPSDVSPESDPHKEANSSLDEEWNHSVPFFTTVTLKEEGFSGLMNRAWRSQVGRSRPLSIKYFQPLITMAQVTVDLLTIALSYGLAYLLWAFWGSQFAPEAAAMVNLSTFYMPLAVTLLTLIVGFQVNGLYHPHRSILNIREFEVLLKTCIVGAGITLAVLFLAEQPFFNRTTYAFIWLTLITFMFIQRTLFFKFQNYLRVAGVVKTTALIYGAGEIGKKLLDKLHQSPKLGYYVAGFIDDASSLQNSIIKDVPVLGGFEELNTILRETKVKKLFIALPHLPQRVVEEVMRICRSKGCDFQMVPSLYDIVIQRVELSEVDGIPLIGVSEPRYSLRTQVAKRFFDFTLATLLLVVLSPLFLAFAVLIKKYSKGPIFFRQKRVGKNGQEFDFYKFRSMYTDTPVYAKTPDSGHDARITPIGRFLRRSSLDELPQLWNVIKGEMSLVGPRPEMPFIVNKYNELQRQRLNVRPGITGLWQISPDRKLAIHANMDYDIYYISNQSFLLDIVIMVRTAVSCLIGVGAY